MNYRLIKSDTLEAVSSAMKREQYPHIGLPLISDRDRDTPPGLKYVPITETAPDPSDPNTKVVVRNVTENEYGWIERDMTSEELADLVPERAPKRGFFLVLNSLTPAITRADIKAQLAGNENALIELEEATFFERSNPLINQLATSFGKSSAEVDQIFIQANQV